MGFSSLEGGVYRKKRQDPDCTCQTCDRDIHHLGIMSHRAMHRRRNEDCKITFSDGRTFTYRFNKKEAKE